LPVGTLQYFSLATTVLSLGYVLTRRHLSKIALKDDPSGSIYSYEAPLTDIAILGLPKSLRMGTIFLALATFAAMETDYLWPFVSAGVLFSCLFIFNEFNELISSYLRSLMLAMKYLLVFPYVVASYAPTALMLIFYALNFDAPTALNCFDTSVCERDPQRYESGCKPGEEPPFRYCWEGEHQNDFFIKYYTTILTATNVFAFVCEDLILRYVFKHDSELRELIKHVFSLIHTIYQKVTHLNVKSFVSQ